MIESLGHHGTTAVNSALNSIGDRKGKHEVLARPFACSAAAKMARNCHWGDTAAWDM